MVMANLVFYEGWLDTLINLSNINGKEFAKDAAWEILNYGIKGEYSTDDENLIGFVDGLCYAQIKKSQNRYETYQKNGEQGGFFGLQCAFRFAWSIYCFYTVSRIRGKKMPARRRIIKRQWS